jgi:hypothetical protein
VVLDKFARTKYSKLTGIDVCYCDHEARSNEFEVLSDDFNRATKDASTALWMYNFLFDTEDGRWSDGCLRIARLALPCCIAPPTQTIECFGSRSSIFLGCWSLVYPHIVIRVVAIYPVVISSSGVCDKSEVCSCCGIRIERIWALIVSVRDFRIRARRTVHRGKQSHDTVDERQHHNSERMSEELCVRGVKVSRRQKMSIRLLWGNSVAE